MHLLEWLRGKLRNAPVESALEAGDVGYIGGHRSLLPAVQPLLVG